MSSFDGAEQIYARHAPTGIPELTAFDRAGSCNEHVSILDQSGLALTLVEGAPVAPPNTRQRQLQLTLKRWLLDLPVALSALVVLSPLLLFLAVAIKLGSKGPILFTQERLGLHAMPFRLLKFRTLRMEDCDASGLNQITLNDGRLTTIGRFLRATSLDELPQLWNILIGDMSIIGPRPMVQGQRAAGQDYRRLVPYYDFRLSMRPGLSGWAQANGLRGPTTDVKSALERINHDCAYIQNFSLFLDIRIIFHTIRNEFLNGSGF